MSNWMDDALTALTPAAPQAPVAQPAAPAATVTAAQLTAASQVFSQRGQSRNAETCADMAAKLRRFGSFVSQKQADYAAKLCEWAGTLNPYHPANVPQPAPAPRYEAPKPAPVPTLPVPQLSALIAPDRFGKVTVGSLKFTLRNDPADLVWVKDGEQLVAIIDRTTGTAKAVKYGLSRREEVFTAIAAVEVDPRRALEDHGVRTGRCGCCGRLLTDEGSIARGVGPICAEKAGWF